MRKLLLLILPALLSGCILHDERPARRVIPARQPVSAEEIGAMWRGGLTAETIRAEIRSEGVIAKLTTDEIVALKEAGVPENVIAAAISAPVTTPSPAVVVEEDWRYERYGVDFSEAAFGLGMLFGWGLGGWHGGPRHSHWHRSRW